MRAVQIVNVKPVPVIVMLIQIVKMDCNALRGHEMIVPKYPDVTWAGRGIYPEPIIVTIPRLSMVEDHHLHHQSLNH